MKKIYLLFFMVVVNVFSQAPANYYANATGTGFALKTQLKTIISADNIQLTSAGYGALWTLYSTQLRDNFTQYDNDGSLFDIYSENPIGPDPFNYTSTAQQDSGQNCVEGGCYNREHLIPQSYFDKFTLYPMRNDAHHVVPSDKVVNAERGNYPFGKVATATYTSLNGSKKGNNLDSGYSAGYSGVVFEPLDDFKGDVARSFFYFATRYEDNMDEYFNTTAATTACKDMFNGSINIVFSPTFLNILLTWNINDPVSAKEISFNNKIYIHQGNRNPYIDNNSYVASIWGVPLSTDTFDVFADTNIYPNPSADNKININTTLILDEIQIININGQIMQMIQKPEFIDNNFTIDNLTKGFYFVKMNAENQSITKKVIVN